MTALELRDVFRVYSTPDGDAAALQGLSLTVRERELLTVLGPSGSGKTTLLRLVAGFDRPSAGTVRVFGQDVGKLSGTRLAAYRANFLGYVDQHYSRALAGELPAWELVSLQLAFAGASPGERRRRADELLERVGLLEKRAARPAELSGGEQQRVAVCAAIAHRPRLLLADEPAGELDAGTAARVYELVAGLARAEGTTALVVSHDPQSTAVADRVVRIRDGRVSEEAGRGGGEGAIVVGRGGWLRLPEELLLRAGIRSRAVARLDEGGIVVTPPDGVRRAAPDAVEAGPSPARPRVAGGVVAEARALAKEYGRGSRAVTVFSGLDVTLEGGRMTVVTGPSGSGKTTLLRLLAGLDRPSEGAVVVLGTRLAELHREARAAFRREHVALVRQDPGLVPFLSARENAELALAIRGVHPKDAAARATDALAAVGLAERAEQRVGRLSAGERQRVAIARALAARPALLLADEPTARLDEANALAVGALFAELARLSGAAVVCATHDPLVVEQADEELPLGAGAAPPALVAGGH